jgi:hypothetical protein
MRHDAVTHDVVLARGDGSKRKFRIYGRPLPENGETIELPVDERMVNARVTTRSENPEIDQSADAELAELIE